MFSKKGVLRNFAKFETLAQFFSCEFGEISKNTFSYRIPPVAASISSISMYSVKLYVNISSLFPREYIGMSHINFTGIVFTYTE